MTHHSDHSPPDVDSRIAALIKGLEADGYAIGLDHTGKSYWIRHPRGATPEFCGLMQFNLAKRRDPELEAALLPYLSRHHPFASWFEWP